MWRETSRFRAKGEDGAEHILVEMTATEHSLSLFGKDRATPTARFYFVLGGADGAAMSDGRFRHTETGDILSRVEDTDHRAI